MADTIKESYEPLNVDTINEDGAVNLAIAIVLSAADDYKKAYKKMLLHPFCKEKQWECEKLERFFSSDYFQRLCTLDGQAIIERIRHDVETDRQFKKQYPKTLYN